VKDGNADGKLDEWIDYLKSLPDEQTRAGIINKCGGGSNAVHMAATRNDSKTLEVLCDLGGGTYVCVCTFMLVSNSIVCM